MAEWMVVALVEQTAVGLAGKLVVDSAGSMEGAMVPMEMSRKKVTMRKQPAKESE